MERIGAYEKIASFMQKEKQPYEFKRKYAQIRAEEFANECDGRELNYHVSVGGLDSIILYLFLNEVCSINVPGVSASSLEDKSIQKIHKALGIINVPPLKREDGTYWTKPKVIQEFGFPVISKEVAAKIELLQNPSEKNKTVRHAIITAALLIAGCSDTANVSAGQENTMVLVESGQEYLIYADNDTGVMYLYITISTGGCLTVMLNADSTTKIWDMTIWSSVSNLRMC